MRRRSAWAAAILLSLANPAAAEAPFDRAGWQRDFALLKRQMEAAYANLAWAASPASGIDVPALDRRTARALEAAESDEEARSAIRRFVAGFHDGHFSELPALAATGPREPEPPKAELRALGPAAGCAALGYANRSPTAFSLPFESLPGFRLLHDGAGTAFRTGLSADGRIGVVRIRNFNEIQYPSVCERAWREAPASLDRRSGDFSILVQTAWLAELAGELRELKRLGAERLIVDIGANSGGNELGDWAARLFTGRALRSAPLRMTSGPLVEKYFREQEEALKAAAPKPASPAAALYAEALRALAARRAEALGRACDLAWAWREQRPWRPDGCSRLADAGWASGPFWPSARLQGRSPLARALYWPAAAAPFAGAWTGPVFVQTSGTSYSAAEMFAAVMRDNGVARTVGTRTGGDGCGFMVEAAPLVLPHSRLRFRMPNCVRLRADGSNEVAGVAADIAVDPVEGESPRARAARLLRAVAAAPAAP